VIIIVDPERDIDAVAPFLSLRVLLTDAHMSEKLEADMPVPPYDADRIPDLINPSDP
jgi:hypothetical protein